MTNQPRLFISYSRRNAAFTRKLHDTLKADGYEIWVDWEDIPFSQDWWQEIREGIDESDVFLFVMTPDSLVSEVCGWEVRHARQTSTRIIPIVRQTAYGDDGELLPQIHERLYSKERMSYENWQALQKINWLFFRDEDDFDTA